jgi:hypothetical protein
MGILLETNPGVKVVKTQRVMRQALILNADAESNP